MIEALGRVVALEADTAWVETERQSSCGSCSAKGCGTGALARVVGARTQRVRVANGIGAGVGDTIALGLREDALLRGSLAVYIVPLVAMLAGALLGEAVAPQWAASPDAMAAFGGVSGLLLGLWWLRGFGRRAAADGRYQATALKIVHRAGEVPVGLNLLKPTTDKQEQE